MAFKIDWTARAERDVFEITDVIRADNPVAAERFHIRLLERVAGLERSPRLGAVHRHRRGFEMRQIMFLKYRIFYRIRPRLGVIEILSVWHGARQEPKLP